jgi:hypothetical protein
MVRPTLTASIALLLAGCASLPVAPPPRIQHVVLVKLRDPAQGATLLEECRTLLATIPSIRTFAAGSPLANPRPTVDSDYDVGFAMGFDNEEAYAAYVEHPQHQDMLRRWGPRVEWIRQYDVDSGH